ncbi:MULTISPECIES: hypothetical protein [Mycobacteriaceae]|nr:MULTISPECIES: hypothetical protein [Mycobacteriaceae]MCK0177486.1 hypothetical protein [Mycolicibacterium sp. F2034L]
MGIGAAGAALFIGVTPGQANAMPTAFSNGGFAAVEVVNVDRVPLK